MHNRISPIFGLGDSKTLFVRDTTKHVNKTCLLLGSYEKEAVQFLESLKNPNLRPMLALCFPCTLSGDISCLNLFVSMSFWQRNGRQFSYACRAKSSKQKTAKSFVQDVVENLIHNVSPQSISIHAVKEDKP